MRDNRADLVIKQNLTPEQKEARYKLRAYIEQSAWDEAMQTKRERWLWDRPKQKTHNQ